MIFLYYVSIQFFQNYFLERVSFLKWNDLVPFFKKNDRLCATISGLFFFPFIYSAVFISVSYYVDYCSFIFSLDVKQWKSFHIIRLFEDCFRYFSYLQCHMNLRISMTSFTKQAFGIMIEIVLMDQFGEKYMSTMLSFKTHEYSTLSHSFRFFFIFSQQCFLIFWEEIC